MPPALELHRAQAKGEVQLKDLSLVLGADGSRVEAVRGIDLRVAPGELLVLLGPSGCGKSTLLGAIAGFIPPTRGEVQLDSAPVRAPAADRGMVFQQHTLLPWRSVIDNVAFALKVKSVPRRERRQRAAELLAVVGLQGFERHYPAQLSGGMQQRVELARVLINSPSVVLMDEPFGALDAQTRLKMQELLLDVWQRLKTTIVFVTHDIDEAIFLADRVVVLTQRPGRIRAELPIDFPRPRSREVLTSAAFVQHRRRCLELLREEEGEASASQPTQDTQDRRDDMLFNRRQTVKGLAGGALTLGAFRTRRASAADPKVVRVGYQKFGLLVTLKARGTLDRALGGRGVKVEWSEFPGGIQLVEALQAGKLDLGVVGEGPPVFAQAAGAPVVYLGAEPPAPEGEAIIVRKDSPIKTVADLRGKHVVLNKGANVHYLLLKALEEAGVAYGDLKISFVPPAGARAAFESGQVDAWAIWDPFLASVEEATGARVLRDGRGLAQNPAYYIGTRPFAEVNPQLVQTFLGEVRTTGAWANENHAKVVALLAPLLGIKEAALARALGRNRFGLRAVDDDLLAGQQKVADTFHAQKLIPRAIRVGDARWKSPRV